MNEFITGAAPYNQMIEKEPFSYDGYQILRRRDMTSGKANEPAVVIRKESITFNTACINGLEDAVYIEILINAKEHSIAVRQCDKNNRDAQRWCIDRPDKRKTRRIGSTRFTQMLYETMNWSDKCRYKVSGKQEELSSGAVVYIFNLDKCDVIFEKNKASDVSDKLSDVDMPSNEASQGSGGAQAASQSLVQPNSWDNSFGVPVNQQQAFDIDSYLGSNSFVSIKLDQGD